MPKPYKILLVLVVLLLAGLIYIEASRPDPVIWVPTYSVHDKIPLGTYVFFHSLKNAADKFESVDKPPYNFLADSTVHGTYFFVHHILDFNKPELKRLLNWVKKGNTLFVSATYFSKLFMDTLNLKGDFNVRPGGLVNYPEFNFVNPSLKSDTAFVFDHNQRLVFFGEIDTLKQTVLGYGHLQNDTVISQARGINFIKEDFGKGEIFVHSSPEVFSNFFMLYGKNHEYAQRLLAYINLNNPILYDVYRDGGKTMHTSLLYVFFRNRYLKWAYYFILIGAVLFIVFEGKRKQKAIKVVPPAQNRTYAYTRTISGMYLSQKDHTSIAHKKIEQFLDFVRVKLRTEVQKIDGELIDRLSQLTDNSEENIRALLTDIQRLQESRLVTKKELLALNEAINNFKNKM